MFLRLLLFGLFSLSINNIFSQFKYFKGGILGGIAGSQMDGDELGGYNKPGIYAGFFVNREINNSWRYQIEMKYINKGAYKKSTVEDPQKYHRSLHYIELPFLMNYKVLDKVYFESGLSAGYLFRATVDFGNGKVIATEEMKKYDFNFLLGIFYSTSSKFSFDLRFAHSILPVSHYVGNRTLWGYDSQVNNVLSFGINYTFK